MIRQVITKTDIPRPASAVSNYLIDLYGHTLKQAKLQKLLYLCHGWNLAIYDKPLIREPFIAKEFGPFLECIHFEYYLLGNGLITHPILCYDDNGTFKYVLDQSDKCIPLIERVIDIYGEFTYPELFSVVYDDLAYQKIKKDQSDGILIPNSLIKESFIHKIKNSKLILGE